MPEFNAPFFGLLTTVVKTYREQHGEQETLDFMHTVFSRRLGPVYDQIGFRRGNPEDFAKVVGENDRRLGLDVSFEIAPDGNEIKYRFLKDPLPGLKGEVDPRRFDATYMRFKVEYVLGEDWEFETPNHIWEGAPFTEHVIRRKRAAARERIGVGGEEEEAVSRAL